ncbi:MAG TPA: hypothetical protein VFZ44_12575 [Pyrinomonadaceae bacterium]
MRYAQTDGSPKSAAARAARSLLPVLLLALWAAPSHAQTPAGTPASAAQPIQARQTPRTATLADYRERVRGAAALLEELAATYQRAKDSSSPEVWSKEDFSSDFIVKLPETEKATFAKVRGLLPQKERVQWGGGVSYIEADNTWLHTELGDPKRESEYGARALSLRAVAVRLRALEARLAELEGGGAADATDRDAERGRLNAILRGREFDREAGQQQGNALQRLVKRFIDWLRSLLPEGPSVTPGASPRASMATQVIVLALCLAVLAYVGRLFWKRRRPGAGSLKLKRKARVVLGERLEADQTASDLLDDAERLARAGDLRGAIRKAYVALLCELGDRGVVRLAQHKTNRDYLNAVRRAAPPGLYTEMLPLTFDFEVHWYGLRDASDTDWESFKTRCRNALKGIK